VPRVLIVAASPFERAGLDALLASDADITSASQVAASPADVAEAIEREQPDVVVVALDGDDDDVLTAVTAGEGAHPALVVLADEPDLAWATEALRAGARAVLPRDSEPSEIVAAVRAAAAGLIALHPDVLDSLLPPRPATPRARQGAPGQSLTPREVEVLRMLAEGLGNKEIATRLAISEHTVKFHVTSIFTKLNASSRTEAVTLGVRRGLIML
jgi:DNA-binding NarL/FixJ family response regulator